MLKCTYKTLVYVHNSREPKEEREEGVAEVGLEAVVTKLS